MDRQRIDKWLWYARMVRTRSAAAALTQAGHVRINGERTRAPSRAVKAGDVITLALDRAVRVLKVKGFAERRGAFESARLLYEDLDPPALRQKGEIAALAAGREAGAGRPTKRERRAIERFTGHS